MKRLGILGGGQLGKMLLPECMKMDIPTWVLDPDPDCSCAPWCKNFVKGDFRDYQTVLDFGQHVDIITVEIEQVNTDALHELEKQGKEIHPSPRALEIIRDKGLQKQFYAERGIPTSPFILKNNAAEIREAVTNGEITLPFVQKSREMGYDGKGVSVIRNQHDLYNLMDTPSVIEDLADIQKEIAIIVAQDKNGNVVAFPSVEMVFHPTANLVEFLIGPADVPTDIAEQAEQLAKDTLKAFDIRGVLAVEMFYNRDGSIWINEVAPRPHNSGHHTIEACSISQYGAHIRSVMGWPLIRPLQYMPGAMINLLGAKGQSGKPVYTNVDECLSNAGTSIHLYGKTQTRPFRKMGHVSILKRNRNELINLAMELKDNMDVVAESE